MIYLEGLPDTSLTVALMRGGRQFFGWGQERYMIADVYDALNLNTKATGNWGKGKSPKIPPYTRPAVEEVIKKKVSVKSMWSKMQSGGWS